MSGQQNAHVVRIFFASLHDEKGRGKCASRIFPYFFEPPEVDEGIQILQLQFFSFFSSSCVATAVAFIEVNQCMLVSAMRKEERERKEMKRRVTMQSSCWWEQLIYLFFSFLLCWTFFSRLSIVNLHSSTFTHHSIWEEQRHLHKNQTDPRHADCLFVTNTIRRRAQNRSSSSL